jgi:hypothetical protein
LRRQSDPRPKRQVRRSTRVGLTVCATVTLVATSCISGSPDVGRQILVYLPGGNPKHPVTSTRNAGAATALGVQMATTRPADNRSEGQSPPADVPSSIGPSLSRYPLLQDQPVALQATAYWAWALLDLNSGKLTGSANFAETSDTASLIKAWIAADYLRRQTEQQATPSAVALGQLSIMIRDSDNNAASMFYRLIGNDASITRMITICGLTDTRAGSGNWSLTMMSARDIARLGGCIASGKAAGPQWSDWLIRQMRQVRGDGRFGIIDKLPAAEAALTSVKNGWLIRDTDQQWHINCLAFGPGWALGVYSRYAPAFGKQYGEWICESVGQQLMP